MHIIAIGLDLAKNVFQAHGVDEVGKAVLVKKLHRKQMIPFFSKLPPCLIGVGTSSARPRQCPPMYSTPRHSPANQSGSV